MSSLLWLSFLAVVGFFCTVEVLGFSSSVNVEKWYGRSVYFVVTDRFAKSDESADSAPPCMGKDWCGGTLRGVTRMLPYIQNMGFDAIWITPVVKQVDWRDNWNGTGYHGYWASDFFKIDPHLGTEDDLLELKRECEKRDVLLMLDVVANHVGPVHSIAQVQLLGSGLNSKSGEQFHQLSRQPGESFSSYIQSPVTMEDAGSTCWPGYNFGEGCNYTVLLDGWFGDLADLRQENHETCQYLLHWVHFMAKKYGIDGFRLDTALYLPKWFLQAFQEAAGTYMIGEVVTYNFSWHRSFSPPLTGLLNFPVTEHLKVIFSQNGSMVDMQRLLEQQQFSQYPFENLLGNFVDNHDTDRFLYNHSGDLSTLRNGLTWTMLYHGLPIVYYGTEQVDVSNQLDMRMSMWPHYGITDMYEFLGKLNALRKKFGIAAGGKYAKLHAAPLSATTNAFAFVRGELLVLVTNTGLGRQTKLCVKLTSMPLYWINACHKDAVETVLGNASKPECANGNLCMQTENGYPSVFALTNRMKSIVV